MLPGAIPVVGHTPKIYLDARKVLERGYAAFGPVFRIDLGFGHRPVVCLGPSSFDLFKHRSLTSVGALPDLSYIFGQSLIGQDGAVHRHMRSAMNPLFSSRGMEESGVGAMMANIIDTHVARWGSRRRLKILEATQALTFDIVFHFAGASGDTDGWLARYRDLVLGGLPIPIDLPGFPRRRGLRAAAWIDARFREIIAEARKPGAPLGIPRMLIEARDEEGRSLSEEECVDNLRLLLFAGHETSSSVMAWLVIMLATQPNLWQALNNEVLGSTDASTPRSIQAARQFPVAEALFRETLRRYAPSWLPRRRALEPFEFGGREIPAESIVCLSPAALMLDSSLFPDPLRFDISRWLGRSTPPSALEVASFGAGAHFCIGYGLSWLEIVQFTVALARIMARQHLSPRLSADAKPVQRFLPIAHPHPGVHVEFK
jgi:cytochrome P450 family 117 subfamily A